ncbi:MAG: hypothetical protein LUJ09_03675, partial [Firmicutes bacterium]|nr:hypothetical protein [Bacillota bacterium]
VFNFIKERLNQPLFFHAHLEVITVDLLKGKEIMVWTFMGNTRMYQALRDYGDRTSEYVSA